MSFWKRKDDGCTGATQSKDPNAPGYVKPNNMFSDSPDHRAGHVDFCSTNCVGLCTPSRSATPTSSGAMQNSGRQQRAAERATRILENARRQASEPTPVEIPQRVEAETLAGNFFAKLLGLKGEK